MTGSHSSSRPTDFHHLKARLKIPLAPAFLAKPQRFKISAYADIKDDLDGGPKTESGNSSQEEDIKPSTLLKHRSVTSGATNAVNESIASLLMKYIPSLGSVLVAYLEPPTFLSTDQDGKQIRRSANQNKKLPFPTLACNGWGVIDVEVKLLGWRPTIGQKLIGRPTLSSPSHLSLVIYRTFNASIPENHLKSAGYYFDINVEVPINWKTNTEPAKNDSDTQKNTPQGSTERGCWIDADGKIVGAADGTVSFTVIGLKIANHMISVIGSLHDDPFSIEPDAPPSLPHRNSLTNRLNNIPLPEDSSDDDRDSQSRVPLSMVYSQSPPTIRTSSKPNVPLPSEQLLPLTSKNLQAVNSPSPKYHSNSFHQTDHQKLTSSIKGQPKTSSSSSKKKRSKRTSYAGSEKPHPDLISSILATHKTPTSQLSSSTNPQTSSSRTKKQKTK